MDFQAIHNQYQWVQYTGQTIPNVTYVYVLNRQVSRLFGRSDILYIGKTRQTMRRRFRQETTINNTLGNTQHTNIRLTHLFSHLNLDNVSCYFTAQTDCPIQNANPFLLHLQVWDKRCYRRCVASGNPVVISLEKRLLVTYAVDHGEVPPLNNRAPHQNSWVKDDGGSYPQPRRRAGKGPLAGLWITPLAKMSVDANDDRN